MTKILFIDLDWTVRKPLLPGTFTKGWIEDQAYDKESDTFIGGQYDLIPITKGAVKALNAAKENGWFIYGITNQGGVKEGYKTIADVEQENLITRRLFPGIFEDILFSVEDDDSRKPNTGMIDHVLELHPGVDRNSCLIVGDMLSDMELALNSFIDFAFPYDFFETGINSDLQYFEFNPTMSDIEEESFRQFIKTKSKPKTVWDYEWALDYVNKIQQLMDSNHSLLVSDEAKDLLAIHQDSSQEMGEDEGENRARNLIEDATKRAKEMVDNDPSSVMEAKNDLAKTVRMANIMRERPLARDMEVDYILDQAQQPEMHEYFMKVVRHRLMQTFHQDVVEDLIVSPAKMEKMVEMRLVAAMMSNTSVAKAPIEYSHVIKEPVTWRDHRRKTWIDRIGRIKIGFVRKLLSLLIREPNMRERMITGSVMVDWIKEDIFPDMEIPKGYEGRVVNNKRIEGSK